jgi:hypothetical protein
MQSDASIIGLSSLLSLAGGGEGGGGEARRAPPPSPTVNINSKITINYMFDVDLMEEEVTRE